MGGQVARFDELLAGDAVKVVHVSGLGGIGKSSLLRTVARRATDAGYAILWIDGRDLPPFPNAVETALEPVHDHERTLVVFDS